MINGSEQYLLKKEIRDLVKFQGISEVQAFGKVEIRVHRIRKQGDQSRNLVPNFALKLPFSPDVLLGRIDNKVN